MTGARPDSLFGPRHRAPMLAVLSTVGIVSYNNLAVAAGLPDVGDDLGDIELLPWVITLELLTSAVAVLASGPVVDGFGVRRTFRAATVGFVATSILVAVAPSMIALLVARAIQGIFGGVIMTSVLAGIGLAIPEKLRPRAFASISGVWGVMGVAGPAIAAILVITVGWRGIFLVNVPITALAAAMGWNVFPERQEGASPQRNDAIGIALITIVTASALSLSAGRVGIMVGGGLVLVVSGAAYRWWAAHNPAPVLRLPHITALRYRTVHITSMAVLAGGVGANSLLPVYLRGVRGTSVAIAAFSVLFLTVGWTTGAFVSSRLQDRWSGEWVSLLGSLNALPGAALTALMIHADAPLGFVCLSFTWLGFGVGSVTSTGAALLQSRADTSEMGRVNGAHQFMRTMAMTLGIALVGAVTLATVDRRTGDVEAVRDLLGDDDVTVAPEVLTALADGYAIAITLTAVIVACSLPSALHLVRHRRQPLPSAA